MLSRIGKLLGGHSSDPEPEAAEAEAAVAAPAAAAAAATPSSTSAVASEPAAGAAPAGSNTGSGAKSEGAVVPPAAAAAVDPPAAEAPAVAGTAPAVAVVPEAAVAVAPDTTAADPSPGATGAEPAAAAATAAEPAAAADPSASAPDSVGEAPPAAAAAPEAAEAAPVPLSDDQPTAAAGESADTDAAKKAKTARPARKDKAGPDSPTKSPVKAGVKDRDGKGKKKKFRVKVMPSRDTRHTTAKLLDHGSLRILLVTEVRGNLQNINSLVDRLDCNLVISTGNFGFFDEKSEKIPLSNNRKHGKHGKGAANKCGDLPAFLRGDLSFRVPVYAIWGSSADVRVVGKFRTGEYSIPNLYLLDELTSHKIGSLRLLGLCGAVEYHKMFNMGAGGVDAIAGENGQMWTSQLQIGQLLETCKQTFDASETRVLVSFPRPGADGFVCQLAAEMQCDVLICDNAGTAPGSYWEISVNPAVSVSARITRSAEAIEDVWDQVSQHVEEAAKATKTSDILGLIKTAIDATTQTKLSQAYFRDTWIISVGSSKRDGTNVLLLNGRSVGLDAQQQGIDFFKKRQDSDRSGQSRVHHLRAAFTLVLQPQPAWAAELPTLKDITAAFGGLKPSKAVLPGDTKSEAYVEFSSQTFKTAMKKTELDINGVVATVTKRRDFVRPDMDKDWRSGSSSSRQRNHSPNKKKAQQSA